MDSVVDANKRNKIMLQKKKNWNEFKRRKYVTLWIKYWKRNEMNIIMGQILLVFFSEAFWPFSFYGHEFPFVLMVFFWCCFFDLAFHSIQFKSILTFSFCIKWISHFVVYQCVCLCVWKSIFFPAVALCNFICYYIAFNVIFVDGFELFACRSLSFVSIQITKSSVFI